MSDNNGIKQKDENEIKEQEHRFAEQRNPQQNQSKVKNKRLKKSLMIFGCILGGVIVLGLILNNIKASIFGIDEDYSAQGPYIAIVYVEGSIMSGQSDSLGFPVGYQHQWTLDRIDDLMEDSNNKGLLLFIDSPGGGIYESDELYLKLKQYKDETDRPIYASMGSMAASGGYYIAAAADEIVANRNTWTGSIGVTIGTLFDISELLERYGIKTVTITSGENKAMGSMVDPLTVEQKQLFQTLVDEAYEQFVGIVAQERSMDLLAVREMADGRIYSAKQAFELGLVDQIGTKEDALLLMSQNYNLWDCAIVDIVYRDTSFWGNILRGVRLPDLLSSNTGGDVSALLEVVKGNNKFPISYQCELMMY